MTKTKIRLVSVALALVAAGCLLTGWLDCARWLHICLGAAAVVFSFNWFYLFAKLYFLGVCGQIKRKPINRTINNLVLLNILLVIVSGIVVASTGNATWLKTHSYSAIILIVIVLSPPFHNYLESLRQDC